MDKNIEIHNKGWGCEKWIVNNEKYCGKILFFDKDKKCSYHYHIMKHETFYLQSGLIKIIYGYNDDLNQSYCLILHPGEKFTVEPCLRHQIIALQDSILFEFSTQHFEEDSYRAVKGD